MEEKNYKTVIETLCEVVREQKTDIYILELQVKELKAKLAEKEGNKNA